MDLSNEQTQPGSFDRELDILVVEDNLADAQLIRQAFAQSGSKSRLHIVDDGVRAMEFLRRQGGYAESPRPDFIILDLNMPRMNGHEVLEQLKSDEALREIPVAILTTSSDDPDIVRTYQMGVTCYVPKPLEYDQFLMAIQSIESFWQGFGDKLPEIRG